MSHTVYTDITGPVIPAAWCNDVDTVVYTYFGNGTNLNSPTKLTILNITSGSATPLALSNNTSTWSINGPFYPNVDNTQDLGLTTSKVRTGYFGTSVVTPVINTNGGTAGSVSNAPINLINNRIIAWFGSSGGFTDSGFIWYDGTNNLTFGTNNASRLTIDSSGAAIYPANDNTTTYGRAANRWSTVFTPILDSGTTGSLSLKTNNGTTGFRVDDLASGVEFFAASSGTTGQGAVLFTHGVAANISANYVTSGTGTHQFQTNSNTIQLQILHTASANRNITVTGSNGGNPTIAATAGSPAIVYAGAGGSGTPTNHTLAMYEEGTWTPTLGGTATYTVQSGSYTRVGNLVFIRCRLTVNAIGTGNTTTISGLPFTASTSCPVSASNSLTLATAVVSLSPVISGTSIQVNSRVAANATDGTSAIFGAGTSLDISGSYIV